MYILQLLEPIDTQADWIAKSFPIIRIVLLSLMLICAVVLIVFAIMQETDTGESRALTGQESYYSQNQWSNKEGRIKKWTAILAIAISLLIVLFYVSTLIDPIV